MEIKAIKQLTPIEEAQLLNYLKATGCPVGLLINFGSHKLEWKRFANTKIGVHSRSNRSGRNIVALHPDFPDSPHAILNPEVRWFPADEALRETGMDKLMPPLVSQLRRKVKEFRDGGYVGATETSKSLLNWWFKEPHLQERFDGTTAEFCYFFAQREALETIVYLYDVVGAKDKFDLMRFDGSGVVSAGMFDETWRRYVIKMATGSGKTKVLSLALAWSFFHKLYESDSTLSRNFLVIAPNIIVLDRIYKDFQGLRIFFDDPVIPDNGCDGRNWRDDFQLTLHVQDEVRVTRPVGNIFLTNIMVVETKGQVDEDVPMKMARLGQWCADLNSLQSDVKYVFAFVDDDGFKKYTPQNFQQIVEGFKAYQ